MRCVNSGCIYYSETQMNYCIQYDNEKECDEFIAEAVLSSSSIEQVKRNIDSL